MILNDYMQGPARAHTREETAIFLQDHYAPLIHSNTIPIFLIIPTYHKHTKGSDDLGTAQQFTQSLYKGYHFYTKELNECITKKARIVPVGKAYCKVFENNKLIWQKLFFEDDFHPSVCRTFLQGYVLHWAIFGVRPCSSAKWYQEWDRFMVKELLQSL